MSYGVRANAPGGCVCPRSRTSTDLPASASRIAATDPPKPVPTTIASKCSSPPIPIATVVPSRGLRKDVCAIAHPHICPPVRDRLACRHGAGAASPGGDDHLTHPPLVGAVAAHDL